MDSVRLVAILFMVACPLAAFAQNAATSIGVAEWVHPDALASRPAEGSIRPLGFGDQVVLREEVETTDLGAADFFFANASRLLVGPDCQVTLDRRYYDSRLDVEVKEYSVDTRLRCIAKADNLGADPTDVIVLNTPHGQIVVRDGVALLAFASADASAAGGRGRSGSSAAGGGAGIGGTPDAGMVAAMDQLIVVSGLAFGLQGSLMVSGLMSDDVSVIRRGGFYAYVGRDGFVRGPLRDRDRIARAIQRALEGLLPVAQRPDLGDRQPVLKPVGSTNPPLPFPGTGPPEPPTNCRTLFCEQRPEQEEEPPVIIPLGMPLGGMPPGGMPPGGMPPGGMPMGGGSLPD